MESLSINFKYFANIKSVGEILRDENCFEHLETAASDLGFMGNVT